MHREINRRDSPRPTYTAEHRRHPCVGERSENRTINLLRLRVDARKWYASKVAPKKYGDKIENTHQGTVTVNTINYSGTGKD